MTFADLVLDQGVRHDIPEAMVLGNPGIIAHVEPGSHARIAWSNGAVNTVYPDSALLARLAPTAERPDFPPFLERAGNFLEAAASHLLAGCPILPDDQVKARLAVCRGGCDQYVDGGCAICGCDLAVKATWADQQCPLGKWPK